MTKLSTIPQHQLSITCGLCKHHTLLEVANLIAVVGGDTQPTRYVRGPDAITVEWRVITRIRSFTWVALILLWVVLGLGQTASA